LDALAIGFSLALLNCAYIFRQSDYRNCCCCNDADWHKVGERTSSIFNTKDLYFLAAEFILILLGVKILFEHLL
jgi:putative Mn2+ efflux pump MntP